MKKILNHTNACFTSMEMAGASPSVKLDAEREALLAAPAARPCWSVR